MLLKNPEKQQQQQIQLRSCFSKVGWAYRPTHFPPPQKTTGIAEIDKIKGLRSAIEEAGKTATAADSVAKLLQSP